MKILMAVLVLVSTTGCTHMMAMLHGTGARRPAASEFGLGPRTSSHGLYTATLESAQPLRTRQLQTIRVKVGDVSGGGIYEIEGVRFNMGGWWEFRVAIATPGGADNVTFNLSL